jgi:hypothetical protein
VYFSFQFGIKIEITDMNKNESFSCQGCLEFLSFEPVHSFSFCDSMKLHCCEALDDFTWLGLKFNMFL